MKNILSQISFKKVGLLGVFALSASFLIIFGLTPRSLNVAKSENCSNAPTVATLNPFPYSYGSSAGYGCTDFAPVVARNITQNGNYPQSANELLSGINAQAGDELYVRIYIHNGAQQGLDPAATIARNVSAYITVDGTAEPYHIIGGTLSSENTNSVAGSIGIRTGPNDRLEVVPGSGEIFDYQANLIGNAPVGGDAFTVNLGDMQACFEYSKFIRFKVKVVRQGSAINNQDSNISASLGNKISGQCMYYGNISWQTQGFNTAVIKVRDLTNQGNDVVFAVGDYGERTVDWIEPNHTYIFTLYNEINGNLTEVKSAQLTGGSDCASPQSEKTGWITSIEGGQVSGQCLRYGTIDWSTDNVENVKVLVNVDGRETLMFAWADGHEQINWLEPNKTYRFILRGDGFEKTQDLTVSNLNCGGPAPTPNINYNLTTRTNEYCVGEVPQYTITSSSALAGKKILWSSFLNNTATQEIDADYGFYLDSSGSWSAYGNPWTSSQIGSWRKEANIDGVRKAVNFTVGTASRCNPAPQPSICPAGTVQINPSVIKVDEYALVSVPTGWHGGSFGSNNTQVAQIIGNQVKGLSVGVATISGTGWTAPNGAINCSLPGSVLTVNAKIIPPSQYTAQATASATAYANATCPDGSTATASASASATASATASTMTEAQRLAQEKAQTQAYANALASAQAKIKCVATPTPPPSQYTAQATASATAYANATCPDGSTATASASASATASATASTMTEAQRLAQEKAYTEAFAKAKAEANSKISCGTTPPPPPVCIPNSNYALNASVPVKQGNSYVYNLQWSSTGNHQIKIAQNSTSNIVFTGSNAGNYSIGPVSPGNSQSFYMIDSVCGNLLTSLVVTVPAETIVNPGNNYYNYEYCKNNSCNTTNTNTNYYYINNQGNTIPSNEYRQLSISKTVRSINGGWQENITANPNDTVEFQIIVRNTGNQPINNVKVSDYLPSGLSWVSGNLNNNSDNYIGTLYVNDSRTLVFRVRITGSTNTSIQNVARATGDSVSQVQDDAWVFVQGGNILGNNVNLSYSKKAWNDTKNYDATSAVASKEDYITYTLTVTNSGNSPAINFVITDDLSAVLPYADIVDKSGGNLNGQIISFSGITVPAGGSVSKTFRVRIKYYLQQNINYVMTNTYGNTVTIRINQPQVLGNFIAPKTGADALGIIFGGILTLSFASFKKRKYLISLIRN